MDWIDHGRLTGRSSVDAAVSALCTWAGEFGACREIGFGKCKKMNKVSAWVQDHVKEWARQVTRPVKGKQNALRHCIGSAILSCEFGERDTKRVLIGHEAGQRESGTKSDRKNNDVGLSIARVIKKRNPPPSEQRRAIIDACIAEANDPNGRLAFKR